MSEFTVVGAAVGRNHTLLLTDRGSVFACGDNKSGQCGVGNNTAVLHTPCRISFKEGKIVKVSSFHASAQIVDTQFLLDVNITHSSQYLYFHTLPCKFLPEP